MRFLIYFENIINPFKGGTERAAHNLASCLHLKGHDIITLAKYRTEELCDFPIFYLPTQNITSKDNIEFIEKIINEYKIEVLINEGGNTSDVQLFNHSKLRTKAKIITCLHFAALQGFGKEYYADFDLRSLTNGFKILKKPINQYNALKLFRSNYTTILECSDEFIVLNEEFKKQIVYLTGLEQYSSKIKIIPNINILTPENLIKKKENIILYVGRLQYETKRVDRLLKAWSIVENNLNNWDLVVLGDGPDRKWYESLRDKMNLKRVHFEGRKDPTAYYKKAKIITLVSTHESFGMTLVEGMAFGCVPVVFNSYPTASEILDNGKCGVLVEPFKLADYAKALENLCMAPQKLLKLSELATVKASQYSGDQILPLWDKLIHGEWS